MERRNFVKVTGLLTLPALGILPVSLLATACKNLDGRDPEKAFFMRLVHYNDKRIPDLLDNQNMDKGSAFFGAVPDNYLIYHPGGAAFFIYHLLSGYLIRESGYYGNAELIGPCIKAAEYLEKVQYEDGTFDLLTTNFNSPPDTAFIMEPVCVVLSVIRKTQDPQLLVPGLHELGEILKRITLKAGECLVSGGIHTPNHRWVVCRALARIHSLYPDDRYIQRIDQWLAEGIDIDPDGQYTEKSTGIYSIVVDDSFIAMARLLDRPELYEPVRKNLEMSWFYVHPSGEIVTGASGRQDRGTRVNIAAYYFLYRNMAIRDGNPLFGAVATFIEQLNEQRENFIHYRLTSKLLSFIDEPELRQTLPAPVALPEVYAKKFIHSNVVRYRNGLASATVFSDNYNVFSLQKGDAVLDAVRLCASFFGKGQFKSESLEFEGDDVILKSEIKGRYMQPLPEEEIPGDGDWHKMNGDKRELTGWKHYSTTVRVTRKDEGFLLKITATGTERVPIAIELGFRQGGKLSGLKPVPGIEDAWFLAEGYGEYKMGDQHIRFGPGQNAHGWTQLRGAQPKLPLQSVYITGYSPFEYTLEIN
ncbi:MAG: hypothetical protein V3V53_15240 [Bacteroidales bacterium]